jgi:diguanylate cyclase (GGDEF)-like protein/PAS domain S-box-containing protein
MLEISEKQYLLECSERDRLTELQTYAIAGSEPEPRFDAIARTAKTLFKVPMASITLVDEDRQWFKSAIGFEVREMPKSAAFCPHTIMSNEVMVVPDAALDPRFADNPFVTGGPKIRFYAGAPLITEDGFRLGALCITDTRPRSDFDSEQQEMLKDLASLVMTQMASRRKETSALALAGLAQSLGQPLIAVGQNGMIEFANRPAQEFFGRDLAELQETAMDELISSGRLGAGAEALLAIFQDAAAGLVSRPFKRFARKEDGTEVPVEISVSRWNAASGTGIAVVLRDLSAMAGDEPGSAAFKGEMAANENKEVVLTRVLDDLLSARKQTGLFLLAVDGFEDLCENLGRNMGNTLLQSVTQRLQKKFPEAATIARASGNDFAVLFETIETAAEGYMLAEELSRSFDEVFDFGARALQITASIGFAMGSVHGSTATELISNASFALHAVRRAGGRGMLMYDEALRIRSTERHRVQLELTQALKRGEFRLFYQPQVSLKDRRIIGVEALIRWQHPERGLLQPKDFLLDVEEGSMSLPIGWWTLEAACIQLAAWRAEGLAPIRMGVNLFPAQFRSDRLVPNVVDLLTRYEIEPELLELEVTETIALLHDEKGMQSFRQLYDMGVRIAFDDFGTGYASLSSLQQFPLTTLKLDRSFVRNLLTNSSDAVITRSMITMANDLRLATIAEGVETEEQEDVLRFLGCRSGQGYLYSRPVPASEMGLMLAQDREQSLVAGRQAHG